jgi:hypothetical protein
LANVKDQPHVCLARAVRKHGTWQAYVLAVAPGSALSSNTKDPRNASWTHIVINRATLTAGIAPPIRIGVVTLMNQRKMYRRFTRRNLCEILTRHHSFFCDRWNDCAHSRFILCGKLRNFSQPRRTARRCTKDERCNERDDRDEQRGAHHSFAERQRWATRVLGAGRA